MKTESESQPSIHCEIAASSHETARELGRIARVCALDLRVGFPLRVDGRRSGPIRAAEARITLRIPLEIALASEAAWKLAGRIACFCPQAAVCTRILDTATHAYAIES